MTIRKQVISRAAIALAQIQTRKGQGQGIPAGRASGRGKSRSDGARRLARGRGVGTSVRRGDEASGGGSARLVKAPSLALPTSSWADIMVALDQILRLPASTPEYRGRARLLLNRLSLEFPLVNIRVARNYRRRFGWLPPFD